MRLVRKLLAAAGWLSDSLMEAREPDHSGRYDVGSLKLICGFLVLAAAGAFYLSLEGFTTQWVNSSIASVADGSSLNRHVVVTGELKATVKISCDNSGGCYYLSAIGDRSGSVILVVGMKMRGDGTVTAKGAVGSQLPSDQDIQQAAIQERLLFPEARPTSTAFIDGRKLNDQPLVLLLFTVAIGSFAALLWQSYRVGIVPFSAVAKALPSVTPSGTGAVTAIPCGVTGTLDCGATLSIAALARPFSYRDRSARVSLAEGELTLHMSKWWLRHVRSPRAYVPGSKAVLTPSDLAGEPQAGTAYLVRSSRPAIKLATRHGRLLLAFADEPTRDFVLDGIISWQGTAC